MKRDRNSRHKDPMNPSERIDQLIAKLTDWRGKTFASIRKSILEADREIIEEWKWMGSPVWSHDGIIAVANAHKEKVKLTFAHGAKLSDPDKLFNAGLEGNAYRAIDFFEGDKIKQRALKNLVRAAVDYNQIKLKKKASAATRTKVPKSKKT
jgi:hypothetical protein